MVNIFYPKCATGFTDVLTIKIHLYTLNTWYLCKLFLNKVDQGNKKSPTHEVQLLEEQSFYHVSPRA